MRTLTVLSFVAAVTGYRINPHLREENSSTCFPLQSATFHNSTTAPDMTRSEWWCSAEQTYGFLGFSYPIEDDCDGEPYSLIESDFASMKNDFGASMARAYLPGCYTDDIWERIIKAGIEYDMGVIFQVAWPLNGDPDSWWSKIQDSILDTLANSSYAEIAPFVVHSIEFGTEPIGDTDGGSYDNFEGYLSKFKDLVKPYGIPVGISEDWDRPGIMSSDNGNSLGPVGETIANLSDCVHAHVMPYYHDDLTEADSWNYIKNQVQWLKSNVNLPILISETQWAWAYNDGHAGGHVTGPDSCDCGEEQYTNYWQNFDDNCQFFKQNQVGWFLHSWQQEGTFDMKKDDGSYAIPNWVPTKC
ncbi:uncharacterized protein TRUGW13939_10385 [Talaromyces rugulosus]|uniref:Glycoside hydrolase family 17 protein n=1 Tax=Talaromyces rugulosus TaxID=121627 RepID=A0A7H8RA76_TALRU|nr:uncharacterized protein TRUGW13939_10385 [Talaromyces rugulosus]QKX63216.1 hypothetical protein TRUGW13939_10385 [Talaromyces rugulosus]